MVGASGFEPPTSWSRTWEGGFCRRLQVVPEFSPCTGLYRVVASRCTKRARKVFARQIS